MFWLMFWHFKTCVFMSSTVSQESLMAFCWVTGVTHANLGYWHLTVTLNRAPNRTSTGLTAGREPRWRWPSPQVSMGISGFLWEGGIMLEMKQLHSQTATYSLLYNVKHWYSHCIILWSYLFISCCQVCFSPLIEPEWNKTATTEAFSTVILLWLQSTSLKLTHWPTASFWKHSPLTLWLVKSIDSCLCIVVAHVLNYRWNYS